MNDFRATQAAHNNAVWCDLVSKAHGGETQISAAAWWNRRQSPPYYPNVVTLDPAATSDTLMSTIEELLASPALVAFAVKDSFCALDLASLSFLQLFEGNWIWKAAVSARSSVLATRWVSVRSARDLAAWESAWWRSAAPQDPTPKPTLYPPLLLAAPNGVFLARYEGKELVAGCVLVLSDDVVGFYCAFDHTAGHGNIAADLVSEIHQRYPNRAVVGYESGESLRAALLHGFEPVGRLRVWLH